MIKKIKLTLANAALVFAAAVLPMMAVSGVVSAQANMKKASIKAPVSMFERPKLWHRKPR